MNRLSIALTIDDILRLVNIKYAEDFGSILDDLRGRLTDDRSKAVVVGGDNINIPLPPKSLKVVPQSTATPRYQTGSTEPKALHIISEPPFRTLPFPDPDVFVTGEQAHWLLERSKRPINRPVGPDIFPAQKPESSAIIHVPPIDPYALKLVGTTPNLHRRLRIEGTNPLSKEELLTVASRAFLIELLKLISKDEDTRYQSAIYNYSLTDAQKQTIRNFVELRNHYLEILGASPRSLTSYIQHAARYIGESAGIPFQDLRVGTAHLYGRLTGKEAPEWARQRPVTGLYATVTRWLGGTVPEQIAYDIFGDYIDVGSEATRLIDSVGSILIGLFTPTGSMQAVSQAMKFYKWLAIAGPALSSTDLSFLRAKENREATLRNTAMYLATAPAHEGGQSAFGLLSLHGGLFVDQKRLDYLLISGSRAALGIWPDDIENKHIAVADYLAKLGAETSPKVITSFKKLAKTDKPIPPEGVMPFILFSPLLVPAVPATAPVYSQVKAREIIKLSLEDRDAISNIISNDRAIEGVTGSDSSPAEMGLSFLASELDVKDERDVSYVLAPALIATRYVAGPVIGAGGVMNFRGKPVTVITTEEIENMKLNYEEFVRYLFRTLSRFESVGHEQIYDFERNQRVNGRPLIGIKEDVLKDEEKFKKAMNDVVKFNILLEWYQNIELPRLAKQHFLARRSGAGDVLAGRMPSGMHRLLMSEIISREIINDMERLYLFEYRPRVDPTLDALILNNVFDRRYVARNIVIASGGSPKITERLLNNVARYSPTLAREVAGLLTKEGWPALINYIYSPPQVAGEASGREQPTLRAEGVPALQAALSLATNVGSHYAVSVPTSPSLALASSLAGNKFILTPGTADFWLGVGRTAAPLVIVTPAGKVIQRAIPNSWIPGWVSSIAPGAVGYGLIGAVEGIEEVRSQSAPVATQWLLLPALNRGNDSMLNALYKALKEAGEIKDK